MNSLVVAEQFYSIQGEGPTTGIPAFFLRLTGCNLLCGGKGTEKDKQLHDGATWRCDTIEVWQKGKAKTHEEIFMTWADQSDMPIRDLLISKEAHIVITGGEPLLQPKAVLDFIDFICERIGGHPYIEIETNGTRVPPGMLDMQVSQYNISPKLVNSGMHHDLRINSQALRLFRTNERAFFKFVVSNASDAAEVIECFLKPYSLHPRRVYLMPAAETRDELIKASEVVADICKREGLRFSNRLHLSIWDKKTGV